MKGALLEAMRTAAQSGASEDRLSVYRALSASEVVVPLLSDEELLTVRGRDGRPVGLAFTDLDALRNWQPTGAWGSLHGHVLASLLLSGDAQGLLVNVHGPFGGELDRRELEIVAAGPALAVEDVTDGISRFAVEEGASVHLRVDAGFPDRLRVAAVEAAARTGGIAAVYPLRLDAPGSSHLALGVAVEPGASWAEVASRLGSAIQPHLRAADDVDIVPLSDEQKDFLTGVSPLFRADGR